MASPVDRVGQDKRDTKVETGCQDKSAFLAGKETEVNQESMALLGSREFKARLEKLAKKVRLDLLEKLEAKNRDRLEMQAQLEHQAKAGKEVTVVCLGEMER